MPFSIFFIAIFVLFSCDSEAFMNIESLRQDQSKGFKGESGFRLSGAIGNTDTLTTSFHSMNAYRTDKRELLFLTRYDYGESRKVRNANKGNAHLRKTYFFTPNFGLETFVQAQFDEFKKLNLRTLLGAGGRFQFFSSDDFTVYAGVGSFYEWEELEKSSNERDLRVNTYLSVLWKLNATATASLITYYQPRADDLQDSRLIMDSGVRLRLTERIRFHIDLGLSRDTKPPKGVRRTDTTYLSGFSVNY